MPDPRDGDNGETDDFVPSPINDTVDPVEFEKNVVPTPAKTSTVSD